MFSTKIYSKYSKDLANELFKIQTLTFEEPYSMFKITERIQGSKNLLSLHIYFEERLVGFKIGYSLDSSVFYSWLGGIVPDYRGQGLAERLMNIQHDMVRRDGYRIIRTKTQNQFKKMLIINLRSGFGIVDTFLDENKDLQIVLEKDLI